MRGAFPLSHFPFVLHRTDLDISYDPRNQKIGVIGNGSSGIQIVPSLQRLEGTQLWCFVRSPTWIAPGFGDSAMRKMGKDPKDTRCGWGEVSVAFYY